MKKLNSSPSSPLPPWQTILYLTPVVGVVPALWTLYRGNSHGQQLAVSRLAVTLALAWLLAYSLLWAGGVGATSEVWTLRLLYLNGLLTTGYFFTCFILIVRLWRSKALRLPGISQIAEGAVRKHLSSK